MSGRGVLAAGLCLLVASGCSSVSVDELRSAAGSGGSTCPIELDVPAALRTGDIDGSVRPAGVDVSVSEASTPAPDPVAAQRDRGMNALEATAGLVIECRYEVGGSTLSVLLVGTRAPEAATNLLGPTIARTADLSVAELSRFLSSAPSAGDTVLTANGGAALSHLRVQGDGDAALLVSTDPLLPGLTGDALRATAESLAEQVG